jgi:hypothetical protein
LYEDPPPKKKAIVDRILGNYLFDSTLGNLLGGSVLMDVDLGDKSGDIPLECPKDGHWYYKRECKKVP